MSHKSQTGGFENRGRGIILYLKREGVAWGWRKLHNEELHDFYYTPDNVAAIN